MACYSKKEFAEKCGLETKNLAVYIKRGKVIVTKKGDEEVIDAALQENKAFLAQRKGKQTEAQLVREIQRRLPAEQGVPVPADVNPAGAHDLGADQDHDEDESPDYIMSIAQATKQKLHWEARKKQRETSLLQLKEQKMKGEVIPYQVITPLFLQHNQSMITEFKNAAEEIVRMMAKRTGMSNADQSEMKGDIIRSINAAMGKATEATIKGIESIVNEFVQKKGVGERS